MKRLLLSAFTLVLLSNILHGMDKQSPNRTRPSTPIPVPSLPLALVRQKEDLHERLLTVEKRLSTAERKRWKTKAKEWALLKNAWINQILSGERPYGVGVDTSYLQVRLAALMHSDLPKEEVFSKKSIAAIKEKISLVEGILAKKIKEKRPDIDPSNLSEYLTYKSTKQYHRRPGRIEQDTDKFLELEFYAYDHPSMITQDKT